MIDAILSLWKNRRIVILCYIISVLFSLSIGISFYNTLIDVSENTLSLNLLVKDFDYLIFTDAIRIYSDVLKPYILWFLLIFFCHQLLYTFLSGGITDAIINKKLKFSRFLLQSFRYWGKTLGISILLILLSIIGSALAILIGLTIEGFIDNPNHRSIILMQLPSLLLFLISQAYLFLTWDYSRVLLIKSPQLSTSEAFIKAISVTTSNFFPIKTLITISLLGCVGLGIYLLADELIGMKSTFTLLIMFILQQVFVFFRAFLRLLNLEIAQIFISKQ